MRSARLVAVVPADGADAEVRVDYRVAWAGPPPARVRVELLGFAPAAVEGFSVAGAAGAVRLEPASGSLSAASIALPAPTPGTDEVALSLTYRVRGAVDASGGRARVRLPVLGVDLPPVRGGSGTFHASVRLPEGWSVSGGFPTGLAEGPDGAWEAALPVVPALVSLRARPDGGWRPGLALALDGLAAVVLLAFAWVGWRHLREVAA